MVRFYFLRHGESDWNVERRCVGSVDRPLTKYGRQQARDAIGRVRALAAPPVAIFHSPLMRAADTAQIIGEALGLALTARADLREACLGIKEGAREDDPADRFTDDWIAGRIVIDGAETFQVLGARAQEAIASCLADATGPILIVGHSAFYRAWRQAEGLTSLAVDHCWPYPSGNIR
jgi:broad specificity phosphatase PhoE